MDRKWKNIYILSVMNIEKIEGAYFEGPFYFLSISAILLLTACGGNKYDDAINDLIKQEKKTRKETNIDSDEYKRENSIVLVYNNGKHIQLAFYMPEDNYKKLTAFSYYEKLGDSYEELTHMPVDGDQDRLGLYKKTPDYEEIKGKETKTKE